MSLVQPWSETCALLHSLDVAWALVQPWAKTWALVLPEARALVQLWGLWGSFSTVGPGWGSGVAFGSGAISGALLQL